MASSTITTQAWATFWTVMAGCFSATWIAQVQSVIGDDLNALLGIEATEALWLSSTFIAVQLISIPLAANLVSMVSLYRVVLWASLGFTFFSGALLFTTDFASALLLRAGLALAAGLYLPLGILIVFRTFGPTNPAMIPFGLTVFAIMVSLPSALAPWSSTIISIIGHPLDLYAVFTTIGFCLISATYSFVPREPVQYELLQQLDWPSALLIGAWAIPLCIVCYHGERLDWWGSSFISAMTLLAVAIFCLFLHRLSHHPTPLIDLRLLVERPNFGLAVLVFMGFRWGLLSLSMVYPQYLAAVHGLGIEQVGQSYLWVLLPMMVTFPLVFWLSRLVDPKYLLCAGLLCFSVAALLNVQMSWTWSIEQFQHSLLLSGIGQPLFMVGLLIIATTGVKPPQGPSAGTFINMGRVLGQGFGIGALGALLASRYDFHAAALQEQAAAGSIKVTDAGADLSRYLGFIGRDTLILSYNDTFLVIGLMLFVVAVGAFVTIPRRHWYLPKPA